MAAAADRALDAAENTPRLCLALDGIEARLAAMVMA